MSKIEELREILYKAIDSFGIGSKEAHELSEEISREIVREQEEELRDKQYNIKKVYITSYKALKDKVRTTKKFPTEKMWNRHAYKYNYLNNVSMQYISGMEWLRLKKKIANEIETEKAKI